MKRIGLLTRDCAGINPCIRAIVRTASYYDMEVLGFFRGYEGLMNNDCKFFGHRAVSGIINSGGTILKTARAERFKTQEGQKKAVENIIENELDGLIVVGGNGSLTGANLLSTKYDIKVVGVPATIDNDINGVDFAIGADTAVNVALDALDKIRDTACSLERIFVVEVMGRDCGYIALRVGLAGGCEEVIIPEKDIDLNKIANDIIEGNKKGKMSWIIVVAEGKAKAPAVALEIKKRTNLETREVVLGHIQRGGSPTACDRILAARYGSFAVELLKNGQHGKCVTLQDKQLTAIPLSEAVKPKDIEVDAFYNLIKLLT